MRNYKRKTDRQSWAASGMAQAIQMVVEKKHGINKVADLFNVPRTTLQNRVKKFRDGCTLQEASKKGLGKFRAIFSEEQEKSLVEYFLKIQKHCAEKPTTKDLRRFAYQLAEKNNIQHKFNAEDGMAGSDWYTGFMKRHPELSFRKKKPEDSQQIQMEQRPYFQFFLNNIDSDDRTSETPENEPTNLDELV